MNPTFSMQEVLVFREVLKLLKTLDKQSALRIINTIKNSLEVEESDNSN